MGEAPPRSPLAPERFPDLPVIGGVEFATVEAAVRYTGRKDVMLARLAPGSTIAGVFTKSATRSAAVLDCQEKIGGDSEEAAAILVRIAATRATSLKEGCACLPLCAGLRGFQKGR